MYCFAVVASYSIQSFIQFLYCLFHSDYRGWTCLHHAAYSGYTQTMDILLSTNPKLLDKTDEDGV